MVLDFHYGEIASYRFTISSFDNFDLRLPHGFIVTEA